MTVLDPTRSNAVLQQLPQLSSTLPPESEVDEARREIGEAAGKAGRGQGRRIPAEVRRAIELHAMRIAWAHLQQLGWTVIEDVSARESFDLRCTKGKAELRVEVKGTTSAGEEVILTPGEVKHARGKYPDVALLVVSNIVLASENKPSGGSLRFVTPWKVEDSSLRPLGFSHTVPNAGSA